MNLFGMTAKSTLLALLLCGWLGPVFAATPQYDPQREGGKVTTIALPPLPQLQITEQPETPVVKETKSTPKIVPSKAQGLDVVLVMDSSGSMKKNDPNDLRKPAAKLLLSLLSKGDRASVVSFSDQGYPVAYLTQTDGKLNRDILFSAVDKVSNKGGYTNLTGALLAAGRVFEQAWDEQRKHVVVLMSDGKMDLDSKELDKKATEQLITQLLPMMKKRQIEVHTIAFTESSDMRLLQSISNLTDGHFNMALSDKNLHSVFASIFEQSKEPDILPMQGEYFSVDSNVNEITIVANKESINTRISFTSPSGMAIEEDIRPGNVKWLSSDQFDLITIQQPEPGRWQIFPPAEQNRAYIITDLKMGLNLQPEQPQPGEYAKLTMWLEEGGGLLRKQEVLAALRVDLVHELPNGKIQRMALLSDHDQANRLTGYFSVALQFQDYGRYRIEVRATTGTFERIKTKVVDITAAMQPDQVLRALQDPNDQQLQPIAGAERVYRPAPPPPLSQQTAYQQKQAARPAEKSPPPPVVVQAVEPKVEKEGGFLLGLMIFMIFNMIIAIGAGVAWWLIKGKKHPQEEKK